MSRQEIIKHTDIAEIAGTYTVLTKLGNDLSCKCLLGPGHIMTLFPATGRFNCPVCNCEGDVVALVAGIEKLTAKEALKRLLSQVKAAPKGTVYVLELIGGYYYIGYPLNFKLRMEQHFTGINSAWWTVRHPPVRVENVFFDVPFSLETEVTNTYLAVYGKDRVRGGGCCAC